MDDIDKIIEKEEEKEHEEKKEEIKMEEEMEDEETMDEAISKILKLKDIQRKEKIEYNLVWGKLRKKRIKKISMVVDKK